MARTGSPPKTAVDLHWRANTGLARPSELNLEQNRETMPGLDSERNLNLCTELDEDSEQWYLQMEELELALAAE